VSTAGTRGHWSGDGVGELRCRAMAERWWSDGGAMAVRVRTMRWDVGSTGGIPFQLECASWLDGLASSVRGVCTCAKSVGTALSLFMDP